MPTTVIERPETDQLRLSLRAAPEERVRILRVNLTGDDARKKPADLIGNEIPALGSGHPENPDLVLQDITGSYVDASHTVYEFHLRYAYPSGTIAWPSTLPARLRVHVVTGQTRMYVDLDDKTIGNTYYDEIVDEREPPEELEAADWVNPDAEFGVLVRSGQVQLEVEIIEPAQWNTRWVDWVNMVSSEPMWGLPAGQVQYVGGDLEEQYDPARNQRNLFSGVLHFIAGGVYVQLPDGEERQLDLDERLGIRWRKRILPDGQILTEPIGYETYRVHPRANLTQLLPVYPQVGGTGT